MNISGTDTRPTANVPSADPKPSRAASAAKQPAGQGEASEQLQLSSLGSHLKSALEGSPAHVAKMSELDAAVSSGQYNVDAHAVSGSIIQHSIEFGGGTYLAVNP
jgi:flagellar biosynthesis anti-sigma factor FlgM